MKRKLWRCKADGYTFVELLVVATIVLILASAIMPLARVTAARSREAELRRALREIRTAIDKYKDAADLGQIGQLEIKVGSENYPPDLQTLVDGVTAANDATGRKAQVPPPHSDRPDDARHRMGHAVVSGQAGLDAMGRSERVRRLHDLRWKGPRWYEVQGLVDWNQWPDERVMR